MNEGDNVKEGQALAYFQSIGNPSDIKKLEEIMLEYRNKVIGKNSQLRIPHSLRLGELQSVYQAFFQQYLQYESTLENGYYLSKIGYLNTELKDIGGLKKQILKHREIQEREYANSLKEYEAYKKLYDNKVISRSEFTVQENKFLSSKYPLQQSETELLTNTSSLTTKNKELMEVNHVIAEERSKFIQSLNQFIIEIQEWLNKFTLISPVDGQVAFAGVLQQNQNVNPNEELFIVSTGSKEFFGVIQVPQYNMGKIKRGAETLVKLKSYPYEEYGLIKGELSYLSDVAYRDSVFMAKVKFFQIKSDNPQRKIILKNGMTADAEIVTEKSSLLNRFYTNIIKIFLK
ncbi:HlyD family secretion protein [Pedobacter antarcticus]|uniref:HlyD family secretion protein n=1 Tax=Pedobacter antarcticus TaxID=34086 RepID=UPI00292F0726|nr:HlyD family efflux transporter periplasmic adaptor subunit [Pedobacter antarcticus]